MGINCMMDNTTDYKTVNSVTTVIVDVKTPPLPNS